jgi:hypothetical protein
LRKDQEAKCASGPHVGLVLPFHAPPLRHRRTFEVPSSQ